MTVLKIIKIGNSKGIIIPSNILKKLDTDRIEIIENDADFTLKAAKPLRDGWADAAKRASENSDDELLLGELSNEFEEEDWLW